MKNHYYSYGIIPVYQKDSDFYILCVKNHKSGEWGLPKGSPEKGEKPFQTASRELTEETGITNIDIRSGKLFLESHDFEHEGRTLKKTNTYWYGFVDEMIDQKEGLDKIDDVKWIRIEEAENFFAFPALKAVAKELHEYLQKFPLVTKYTGQSGETAIFEYYESDTAEHLPEGSMSQVQITAFHGDKLLIVNNANKYDTYSLVGGTIEPGETPEECLPRELQEESNMRVITSKMIGYQKAINLTNPDTPIEYQLRYFAQVEPIGEFTPDCDPDGDVTELLEINPKDYKQYFDWGITSDEIMARAEKFLKED